MAGAADASAIEPTLRSAAIKTLEQGRAAYERMKGATDEATQMIEASFGASSTGATEFATKAFEAAKANATATFDHLKALAASKTLSDAVALHGQFIRTQTKNAVAQARSLAELAHKEEDNRAVRLARITDHAERVFGDHQKAGRWLSKANATLEGRTPVELLRTETGTRKVEEALVRIDHGIFA